MALAAGSEPRSVLVGFAESLAAIESAWMLLAAGFRVAAFTRAGRKPALSRVRGIEVFEVTSPQDDASHCVDDIVALATRLDPVAVMPFDDDAVWLLDRAAGRPGFPPVAGPTGTTAILALDKRRQLAAAAAAGLDVPPTAVLEGEFDTPVVPDAPGPWIVKPAWAVTAREGRLTRGGAALCADEHEVRAHAAALASPVLVQPLLTGVGEGLFGQAHGGGVTAWSGHRRIRMMNPAGSGSSACRSVDADSAVIPAAERFLADIGWQGLFMLEFLRDRAGTPWFMELNGRTWGSMVLARHRGLNYPAWAVCSAIDASWGPPHVIPGPHLTARHAGRELLHLVLVARGRPDSAADPEWPRLAAAARSVLTWHRNERMYNLRKGDLTVFLADTRQTVLNAFRAARAKGDR